MKVLSNLMNSQLIDTLKTTNKATVPNPGTDLSFPGRSRGVASKVRRGRGRSENYEYRPKTQKPKKGYRVKGRNKNELVSKGLNEMVAQSRAEIDAARELIEAAKELKREQCGQYMLHLCRQASQIDVEPNPQHSPPGVYNPAQTQVEQKAKTEAVIEVNIRPPPIVSSPPSLSEFYRVHPFKVGVQYGLMAGIGLGSFALQFDFVKRSVWWFIKKYLWFQLGAVRALVEMDFKKFLAHITYRILLFPMSAVAGYFARQAWEAFSRSIRREEISIEKRQIPLDEMMACRNHTSIAIPTPWVSAIRLGECKVQYEETRPAFHQAARCQKDCVLELWRLQFFSLRKHLIINRSLLSEIIESCHRYGIDYLVQSIDLKTSNVAHFNLPIEMSQFINRDTKQLACCYFMGAHLPTAKQSGPV